MKKIYLREWRYNRQLTQEELGERAGVTRNTIGNIESGRIRMPQLTTLERLAKILQIELLDIFKKPKR
jgi:transcriptional regulator with XRE-family HTH domain